MKYEITKEQLWELSAHGIKPILKSMFPDAFKEELEITLIAEAKTRNFLIGTKSHCLVSLKECTLSSLPYYKGGRILAKTHDLYSGYMIIYQSGEWSKIISETKVITMEKALKILSKKYSQPVEIAK